MERVQPFDKQGLLDVLKKLGPDCPNGQDYEVTHSDADDALIEYINDAEIAEAYGKVGKWYV